MQELIDEIVESFRTAGDKKKLVARGYECLSIPYCNWLMKAIWPEFLSCMKKLDPLDQGQIVVALDFSALFHAYFYVFDDRAAQETCAKIAEFRDTAGKDNHFIIALDSATGYWRKELYPDYKSSRKEKPDGFDELKAKAVEILKSDGYRLEQHDSYESDDILSSVAFMAKVRKQEALLITDDKDLYQCLGSGVNIYSPRAKAERDDEWLKTELKITPKQMVDWLCLVGKDDIPSPHKIGEVTASQWLESYGSVVGIHDARESLTKLKRETIEAYVKKDYWLARDLHTLKKNLNIFWD